MNEENSWVIAWNLCNEYATSPATIIKPIRKSEQMANINPLINNNFLFTSLGSKPLIWVVSAAGLENGLMLFPMISPS